MRSHRNGGSWHAAAFLIFFSISFPLTTHLIDKSGFLGSSSLVGSAIRRPWPGGLRSREDFRRHFPGELERWTGNISAVEDWERLTEHDTPLMISAGRGENASWLSSLALEHHRRPAKDGQARRNGLRNGSGFCRASVSLTEEIT